MINKIWNWIKNIFKPEKQDPHLVLYEEVKIDSSSDYVDIYLQSIKQSSDKYAIIDNGTNIVVTFNQAIVASPDSIVASDFLVKGKIVSR